MKRTKASPSQLQTLTSQLVGRLNLANKLGYQYGTDRNIYEALGYLSNPTYSDYYARYRRQDIAKAIIDRPVKVTWRGKLEIIESDDENETVLEKAWKALEKEFKLKSKFVRVDKLSGIGSYGVLVLGLDDIGKIEDYALPVVGKRKLKYVKPLGQNNAEITGWVVHTRDPRYGMPKEYTINVAMSGDTIRTTEIKVHHSRIVHITDEMLESEIEGTPRLEVVYNRLMDLEKLVGGDAEMFWRGARPGYQGKVDEDYQMTPEMEDDLQDQIDEYEHNLRRMLVNKGITYEALQQQLADPANHVDIQIQMISAVTGIPKRILTGSERGELSSDQDKSEWMSYVQSRREEYAEPNIVRPFVDRCTEFGILPKPKEEYSVKWTDLFSQSDKEKADVGKIRAEALSKYAASPMAEGVVPPEEFLKLFLGLSKEEVEQIEEARQAAIKEEESRVLTPAEEELERQAQEQQNKPEE